VDDCRTLDHAPLSPFAGADDLNDPAALQLDGVLFMEGEGEPAELTHLIRDLRTTAEDYAGTGDWLANGMQASWDVAAALADTPEAARRETGRDHGIDCRSMRGQTEDHGTETREGDEPAEGAAALDAGPGE
jgi:hypothetical protein